MTESNPANSTIRPEEILAAEYNYIAQSSFQANEDRARAASFFVVSVSSLAASILGANFLQSQYDARLVNFCFAGAFFLLTTIGFLTMAQLARLRAAWFECARAMAQIKRYCIARSGSLKLEEAFRWQDMTSVPRFKPNSISFYLAVEVALLSAVTFGAAVFFCQAGLGRPADGRWPNAIGAGVLTGLLQIGLYWRMLYEPRRKRSVQ